MLGQTPTAAPHLESQAIGNPVWKPIRNSVSKPIRYSASKPIPNSASKPIRNLEWKPMRNPRQANCDAMPPGTRSREAAV